MKREEAISEWTFRRNHIKELLDEYGEEPSVRHYVELIDMAIEALTHEIHTETHAVRSDIISRQDAIDAFDDNLWVTGRENADEVSCYIRETIDKIKTLPFADAVEVVRCRDCKHYEFADNRAFGMPVKYCDWFGFEDVDDNDFCSRGERKGGDTE